MIAATILSTTDKHIGTENTTRQMLSGDHFGPFCFGIIIYFMFLMKK